MFYVMTILIIPYNFILYECIKNHFMNTVLKPVSNIGPRGKLFIVLPLNPTLLKFTSTKNNFLNFNIWMYNIITKLTFNLI